jgi:hypothetical protein
MAVLVNSRDAPRLLGSTSLLGEAVGSRGASSHARLFWAGTRGESRCAEGARVGACEAADRFVNSASPRAAAPRTLIVLCPDTPQPSPRAGRRRDYDGQTADPTG